MKKNKYKRRESGVIIFESVLVLCVLSLVFFSFLQLYHWALDTKFCQYAAYYAAKGMGLGYKINFARRAARVAAIPISGSSRGQSYSNEKLAAQKYMSEGDASGVWYSYWYPQSQREPEIHLNGRKQNEGFFTRVTLRYAIYLHSAIKIIMTKSELTNWGKAWKKDSDFEYGDIYPSETVDFYDYGKIYLDE